MANSSDFRNETATDSKVNSAVAFFNRLSPQEIQTRLEPNEKEVFRYLGYTGASSQADDTTISLVHSCISEMQKVLKCQAAYKFFDLSLEGKNIRFADISLDSDSLERNLRDCTKIAILAATIGPMADALIKKYTKLDMTRAAIMQATGAMYIEEYVDLVNAEISQAAEKEGFSTKPRFSPGYGDVPLEIQRDFFRLLPCTQKLGLTLMDSLIMSPEKSVTAFVGLKEY